jgi:outer membrane protein assembly factor BamB
MRSAWLPRVGLRTRAAAVITSSLACAALLAHPALANGSTRAITLSPASGPVGTAVQVSGSGFKHKVTVDVFFDSSLVASAVTSRKGAFSNAGFEVPATATPGNHLVTAQDTSDPARTATATFAVIDVNWPEFHHDLSLTGFDPDEALLAPGNVSSLVTRWTQATGTSVESSPAVVGGRVDIGSDDGKVYSLDAATGAVIWDTMTGGAVTSSPAVASGTLYVGSGDGKVYAMNATTGAVLWETTTGGAVTSSPAVASGTVYVGSGDGKVYAMNAATGLISWETLTGGAVTSSPAVASGTIYVGSADGKVYAMNAATGLVLWDTLTGGGVSSSPGVANGVVYVGSSDDNLYALNAMTGAVAFKSATGGIIISSPAVASGVVYVGSADGNVYAYSLP